MHEVIFNLAVMHGGIQTYSSMQRLYLMVCSSCNTFHGLQVLGSNALHHVEAVSLQPSPAAQPGLLRMWRPCKSLIAESWALGRWL